MIMKKLIERLLFPPTPGLIRLGGECAWTIFAPAFGAGSRVVSAGAGRDISFEQALVARWGARVLLLDPSPTGQETLKAPGTVRTGIEYLPMGLADKPGLYSFGAPAVEGEGSYFMKESADASEIRLRCTSLSALVAEQGIENAALLKLDIEGSEYGVLDDLVRHHAGTFAQIAVEFHHRLPGMNVMRQRWRTAWMMLRLRAAGFRCVFKVGGDFLFVRTDLLAAARRAAGA